jgi:hypothetical protein
MFLTVSILLSVNTEHIYITFYIAAIYYLSLNKFKSESYLVKKPTCLKLKSDFIEITVFCDVKSYSLLFNDAV